MCGVQVVIPAGGVNATNGGGVVVTVRVVSKDPAQSLANHARFTCKTLNSEPQTLLPEP